jgi:hypothetical protein
MYRYNDNIPFIMYSFSCELGCDMAAKRLVSMVSAQGAKSVFVNLACINTT